MKKQKVAIFDCDGVLANFEEAFCEAFGNKNRHLYDLRKRYPEVDPELIMEWVNDEENYRDLNPIFGGITLLNQLKSRGFQIDFLTSRSRRLENITLEWFKLYSLPTEVVCFTKSFTSTKADFVSHSRAWHNYEISLFIDDNVEELQEFKKLFPDTVCLAWAQPWNEGYYPRAIYDREKMKVMVNMGDGNWRWIWSKK